MKIIATIFFILLSCYAFSQESHSEQYDVLEYNIYLDITDITNKYIEGHNLIKLTPIEDNTNTFEFDLLQLQVDSIKCGETEVESYTYNDTLIVVNLSNSFNSSEQVTIDIFYHGTPTLDPSGWGGFYFLNGYAFNLGVGFEDIPHCYGRTWFPCNDSFTDKAKYKMYITTQNEHTAACTGELMQVIDNTSSKTFVWEMNKNIPTYLASVAVGDYKKISHVYHGIENDIPVDLFVYPGDSANAVNSFANIDTVLSIYENLFGAYIWNRVGYVEVPFSSGAMEHVTNIAMGKSFINGTLNYQDLFYHELAHMWFGDEVTCSTAEDMWLNEGWATFCETLYKEFLYDRETANKFRRASHEKVLRYYHIQDGGFLPLYPMAQDLTYSSTVYQKGASVAHALRGYLGDSLFFNGIKQYLINHEYQSASSYDMRDFLSTYTQIDMNDFFEAWVFEPGFVHFSIDSTKTIANESMYDVTVYVKQKLRGRETFANSNRVEISFMDSDYSVQTKLMEFDGEYGMQTFTLPFQPVITMCDYNEVLSDATIDEHRFIKNTGQIIFDHTYFTADVASVNQEDSTFIRITHNWVAPDDFVEEIPGLIIADHRYWTVEGIFNGDFKAKGKFKYNKNFGASGYVDIDFITNSADSLVILYRPNKNTDWQIENATHSKILKSFTIDSLKTGEYSFAIWDWEKYTDIKDYKSPKSLVNIYPNPNNGDFYIKLNTPIKGKVDIFNTAGVLVHSENINLSENKITLTNIATGLYFLKITDDKTKRIIIEKFIIEK